MDTTIQNLQAALNTIFQTMLGQCGELIGIGQALGGFGALWFIANRIWGHLAQAEAIDFYPLLRPFAISIVLIIYPAIIGLINGVMQPTVDGTDALVNNSNQAVATLLQQEQAIMQQGAEWQMFIGPDGGGSLDKWEQLSGDADSGLFSGVSNRVKFEMAKASYNLRNSVKVWLSEILQTLFEAAALCINTVRIFYLVVLAIVGLHFTAMSAVTLVPDPLIVVPGSAIAPNVLAIAIATVTALIAGLGLLGLIVDNHLASRAAHEAERLRRSEDHLARAQRIAHTGSIERNLRTGAVECATLDMSQPRPIEPAAAGAGDCGSFWASRLR